MPYYWYIAQEDELMMDIDHYSPDAEATKLDNARDRLKAALDTGALPIDSAWAFPSEHAKHYHLIVKLTNSVDERIRIAWEGYLRDDCFRHFNNQLRSALGVVASLLITPEPYELGFYRKWDYKCDCKSKHYQEVMEACPVAMELRADHRAAVYFPKPVTCQSDITYGRLNLT